MVTNDAEQRPYRIDYFEATNEPFYSPEMVGDQLVVRINRAHPFFQVLYADLLRLPGGSRAKEAIDLVLITLSRAELSDETPQLAERYGQQRQLRWTPFLATALKSLSQRMPHSEEDNMG